MEAMQCERFRLTGSSVLMSGRRHRATPFNVLRLIVSRLFVSVTQMDWLINFDAESACGNDMSSTGLFLFPVILLNVVLRTRATAILLHGPVPLILVLGPNDFLLKLGSRDDRRYLGCLEAEHVDAQSTV